MVTQLHLCISTAGYFHRLLVSAQYWADFGDFTVEFNDGDSFVFEGVSDQNDDSIINIEDLDLRISSIVADGVAGGDVTVDFDTGASITFVGADTGGTINSISDIIDSGAIQINS